MAKHLRYTKAGRVIALIAVILGVVSVASGLLVFLGVDTNTDETKHLPKLTAQWIDGGTYSILFGIVLGVLTEISQTLSRIESKEGKDSAPPANN